MISQQSTFFPKQLKLDDYQPASQQNLIRIMQTSNMLLGNGARTSNTAIIMIKALHFMQDEGVLQFAGKQCLQLGCGAGLLGIYLGCLGANVIMSDLNVIKDVTEKNINLNRDLIKGQVQFAVLNWKTAQRQTNEQMVAQYRQKEKQQGTSTSSSDFSQLKGMQAIDYTIVCQSGNLSDLQYQLKWIGKQGMILGFHNREYSHNEQYIDAHKLQKYLLENSYQYEKFSNYHPDYCDERVFIYRIWK